MSEAQKHRPYELLWMLWFDGKSISNTTNFFMIFLYVYSITYLWTIMFLGANNWLVDHFSLPQQWKYNSRNQNLTHHHSSTYHVKNSIRNRYYHHHSESSLKRQSHFPQDVSTFWNIVYKPLKSIVDKVLKMSNLANKILI